MKLWRGLACMLATAGMLGCSLFVDLSGLSGGANDESDGGDSGASDSASDAPVTIDGGSDSGCAGSGGPAQLRAGGVCIDTTEVTNDQYAAFLAASVPTSSQPSYCSWNDSFEPTTWPTSPSIADFPVVNIDWCDAYAFCAWAGKRLCGAISGGPLDTSSLGNAATDQWYSACSAGGALVYPYGTSYSATACNSPIDDAGPTPGVVAVTADPACVGSAPGLFDMTGNADEWVDSCDGTTGSSDNCTRRGGSCDDPSGDQQTCAFSRTSSRSMTDTDIGIRCCGK
ncbi:MAG: formylglycine-generating enzyme family protein [Polyangiaceae bacterium]